MMRRALIAGCMAAAASQAGAAVAGQPALLAAPSPACMADLAAALRTLTGKTVTLRGDVFTRDSVLLLEPGPPRDDTGQLRDGRQTGMPLRIELRRDGEACVVTDGERRANVPACSCKPRP
jgi:hypothetical protein